jgi:hypothetical protein
MGEDDVSCARLSPKSASVLGRKTRGSGLMKAPRHHSSWGGRLVHVPTLLLRGATTRSVRARRSYDEAERGMED